MSSVVVAFLCRSCVAWAAEVVFVCCVAGVPHADVALHVGLDFQSALSWRGVCSVECFRESLTLLSLFAGLARAWPRAAAVSVQLCFGYAASACERLGALVWSDLGHDEIWVPRVGVANSPMVSWAPYVILPACAFPRGVRYHTGLQFGFCCAFGYPLGMCDDILQNVRDRCSGEAMY